MDFETKHQMFCIGQIFEKILKYKARVNQLDMDLKKTLNES